MPKRSYSKVDWYPVMAYSGEADEDFKLPLRPWLEKQINSGRFKGLEWETSTEEKLFKLPWVKKNLPDWEDYYMIFRAWAEHRGRGVSSNLDDSKLKSNFRCALNKSVDFEEVTSKSKLQMQTGNYKVYRILSPKEVREKKKKRSRIQTKEEAGDGQSSSFDNNFDSADFKTIDKKDLSYFESIGSSIEVTSMDVDGSIASDLVAESMQAIQSDRIMLDASQFMVDMPYTQLVVCPPESEDVSQLLAISPADNSASQNNWISESTISNSSTQAHPAEVGQGNASCDAFSNAPYILTQLENCGIKKEKLNECDVVIRYDGHVVYNETLTRMDLGYRIFYGDTDEQIRLLQMRNATDERLSDFCYTGIPLPVKKHASKTVSAILNKTELGIIIRYDPETLLLRAKRLCQSQVFYIDSHERNSEPNVRKLEREETVTLFSHEKYLVEIVGQHYNHPSNSQVLPEGDVHISIGVKPKSIQSIQHMKGLKIEIVPYAVKFFHKCNRDPCNSSLSLCFSTPSSMEEFLRQVKRN